MGLRVPASPPPSVGAGIQRSRPVLSSSAVLSLLKQEDLPLQHRQLPLRGVALYFNKMLYGYDDAGAPKSSRRPGRPATGRLQGFIPALLPPDPLLMFDAQLVNLLATASTDLGRVDGVSATMPNPDLFVAMYVRREAVLSSQIEVRRALLMTS